MKKKKKKKKNNKNKNKPDDTGVDGAEEETKE